VPAWARLDQSRTGALGSRCTFSSPPHPQALPSGHPERREKNAVHSQATTSMRMLFAFCFLLFAFCFLLFAFCFLLFAFCFLLLAFGF
jgi:hypothetical protein